MINFASITIVPETAEEVLSNSNFMHLLRHQPSSIYLGGGFFYLHGMAFLVLVATI